MSTPQNVPLTYNGFVTQVATLAVEAVQTVSGVVSGVDAPFNAMLPQALNYAELRIQRDLDLLGLETTNSSYSTAVGSNTLTLSLNDFVTVQTATVNGVPLVPVTRQFLQNVYGPGSTQGQPLYFAPGGGDASTSGATSQLWLLGPIPDQVYGVTLSGTVRMPSLATYANTGNASTALTLMSTIVPDMMIMAAMVYVSGFQRNFGAQSDDANVAVSYESQYQAILRGAATEEYRKKFQASAWSSESSSPVATAER